MPYVVDRGIRASSKLTMLVRKYAESSARIQRVAQLCKMRQSVKRWVGWWCSRLLQSIHAIAFRSANAAGRGTFRLGLALNRAAKNAPWGVPGLGFHLVLYVLVASGNKGETLSVVLVQSLGVSDPCPGSCLCSVPGSSISSCGPASRLSLGIKTRRHPEVRSGPK